MGRRGGSIVTSRHRNRAAVVAAATIGTSRHAASRSAEPASQAAFVTSRSRSGAANGGLLASGLAAVGLTAVTLTAGRLAARTGAATQGATAMLGEATTATAPLFAAIARPDVVAARAVVSPAAASDVTAHVTSGVVARSAEAAVPSITADHRRAAPAAVSKPGLSHVGCAGLVRRTGQCNGHDRHGNLLNSKTLHD